MKIKDLITLLEGKDQELDVEYVIVEKDTALVAMELTSEVCDQEKLFKAFRRPSRRVAR